MVKKSRIRWVHDVDSSRRFGVDELGGERRVPNGAKVLSGRDFCGEVGPYQPRAIRLHRGILRLTSLPDFIHRYLVYPKLTQCDTGQRSTQYSVPKLGSLEYRHLIASRTRHHEQVASECCSTQVPEVVSGKVILLERRLQSK